MINELIEREDMFLLATDIAPILGVNPHALRIAARENPKGLGFPSVVIGKKVLFPRLAFLSFMGVKT